ncbi:anthranilate synthase component II [Convivina praedatoris]|uniref:Anthranilate synthase component 2 n=1 Tax=Convivina praedatoris TaxID=2880963 RepID=A0ABM9D1E6_9LACO|nr:aminodeoxychorismate/anthranilate synthase component II [Convivina sp. LMG 32447]CAH1851845.1 Anthranilate synthase component 2 [Convivina sp. LMG 32447]CAH1853922.1 Anthranilate synthase component 2 [Convivina sp. LMG 32447]CAH1854135.1 Anthranilate synthase component 2 [Convivina sp. LMG 32447]
MILLVDNYDSFTYNLAQIVGQLTEVQVLRNDDPELEAVAQQADGIIFSPGPGSPDQAGQMEALIKEHAEDKPMLGICLGHQAIGEVFGGQVAHAPEIRHGKMSQMKTSQSKLFDEAPDVDIMRYHSLIVDKNHLPAHFKVTGVATDDGEVMAIEHDSLPIYGVQFHPESIGTPAGQEMIKRFVTEVEGK